MCLASLSQEIRLQPASLMSKSRASLGLAPWTREVRTDPTRLSVLENASGPAQASIPQTDGSLAFPHLSVPLTGSTCFLLPVFDQSPVSLLVQFSVLACHVSCFTRKHLMLIMLIVVSKLCMLHAIVQQAHTRLARRTGYTSQTVRNLPSLPAGYHVVVIMPKTLSTAI